MWLTKIVAKAVSGALLALLSYSGIASAQYVANNPLRWVDPTGLDATVTYYQGQNGNIFGHIGIGINTSNTIGYNPARGVNITNVLTGQNVPSVMSPDAGHVPLKTVTIHTTPTQDQLMQNLIDQLIKNPGLYNLYNNNCTTAVQNILAAGGISCPGTIRPKLLIYDLQEGRCK